MTNAILTALASNPYGMTVNTLAHVLALTTMEVRKTVTALVADGTLVTAKFGRNAPMYSLPNTCSWSTTAATLAAK